MDLTVKESVSQLYVFGGAETAAEITILKEFTKNGRH
jgi:hypothetical protein